MRYAITSLLAAATLTLPLALSALPPGIPPDGPAGGIASLAAITTGTLPWGTNVTTPLAEVVNVSCPSCESATAAANFTLRDSNGTLLLVHESHSWQSTYNVKKQLFVPSVGMRVVVQGRVENDASGWFVDAKRWAERDHPGKFASLGDIAMGKIATGEYVWIANAKVANVARWNDGDYSFDLTDPAGGNVFVHTEIGPPFWNQLRIPHVNETVTPYGMVRFDPDHPWWELHPVRCWSASECVPLAVPYLRNGPTPGSPATGGAYLEGQALTLEGKTNQSEDTPIVTFTPLPPLAGEIRVAVNSTRKVERVDISIQNGTWAPMDRNVTNGTLWSYHATLADTTMVRFRATHLDGTGSTSGQFTLSAAPTEILDAPDPRDPREQFDPQESASPTPQPPTISTVVTTTSPDASRHTTPAIGAAFLLVLGMIAIAKRRR